jgi:hypothetical protein
VAFLGAEDRGLLLCFTDKDHSFLELELREVLDHYIIFALTLAKEHDRELVSRGKAVQLNDKASAHLAHQRRMLVVGR